MTDNSHGPPGSLAQGAEAELAGQQQAAPATSLSLPANGDSKPIPFALANRPGNSIGNLSVSRSPSNGPSPRSSRDSSPAGRAFRQQTAGASAQGMRSRKDSHDASPHRPPSITGHTTSVPSAAAIQRALFATTPQLQPTMVSETTSKLPQRSQRPSVGPTPADSTPSWPTSPRLRSPPPSTARRDSLRSQKNPPVPPIIVRPSSSTDSLNAQADEQVESEPQSIAATKGGNRGASGAPTLATVQETSNPVTPSTSTEQEPK
jgi:hypothetical protein